MEFVTVKCQRSGHEVLLSDGYLVGNIATGEWCFVGRDVPEEPDEYDIQWRQVWRSPEAFTNWMAHMNTKGWFDEKKFMDFLAAFRKTNGIWV